jgi:hypothetical protein
MSEKIINERGAVKGQGKNCEKDVRKLWIKNLIFIHDFHCAKEDEHQSNFF